MKSSLIICLLILLSLPTIAQQNYKLDIKKSKLLWKAPKTMGNRHYGFVLFNSGSLYYSAAGQPVNGSFSINMNSIRSTDHKLQTDNKKVDDEIKANGFFDVAQYPIATMTVKRMTATGRTGMYTVFGELTMRGITKPIEFDATITKTSTGLNAKGSLAIDRNAWNIKPKPTQLGIIAAFKDKMIAEEIPITLDLVFVK